MSLEAWGDEGNVPQRWEETAMRQEFDAIRARFDKWWQTFKSEGDDQLGATVDAITGDFDELSEQMRGPL